MLSFCHNFTYATTAQQKPSWSYRCFSRQNNTYFAKLVPWGHKPFVNETPGRFIHYALSQAHGPHTRLVADGPTAYLPQHCHREATTARTLPSTLNLTAVLLVTGHSLCISQHIKCEFMEVPFTRTVYRIIHIRITLDTCLLWKNSFPDASRILDPCIWYGVTGFS